MAVTQSLTPRDGSCWLSWVAGNGTRRYNYVMNSGWANQLLQTDRGVGLPMIAMMPCAVHLQRCDVRVCFITAVLPLEIRTLQPR